MSGFGTFILAIFTFIGIWIFFADPLGKFASWAKGKTKAELEAIGEELKGEEILKHGCLGTGLVAFSLLLSFLIEPIYVFTAITGDIGRREFAYVALFILVAHWVHTYWSFKKSWKAQKAAKGVAVITESGEQVTGSIVDDPNRILIEGNPYSLRRWVTRIFWAIPEFYLVYLLLVSMKIITG